MFLIFRGIVNSVVFEMKQILKRDVNKRMVEATAFTALDVWWEKKEQSAKVSTCRFGLFWLEIQKKKMLHRFLGYWCTFVWWPDRIARLVRKLEKRSPCVRTRPRIWTRYWTQVKMDWIRWRWVDFDWVYELLYRRCRLSRYHNKFCWALCGYQWLVLNKLHGNVSIRVLSAPRVVLCFQNDEGLHSASFIHASHEDIDFRSYILLADEVHQFL